MMYLAAAYCVIGWAALVLGRPVLALTWFVLSAAAALMSVLQLQHRARRLERMRIPVGVRSTVREIPDGDPDDRRSLYERSLRA